MAAHHCSCLLRMELVSPTGSKLEGDGSSSWIVSYEFLTHPNSTFTKTRSNRKTTSQSLVFFPMDWSDDHHRRGCTPHSAVFATRMEMLWSQQGIEAIGKTKQGIVKLWCSFFNLTESLWKWNLDSSEIHNSQSSILQSHPANSSGWNRFYGLVLMWRHEVCLDGLKWIMLGNVMGQSEYHINMVLLKLTYICLRWFNLIDNYYV